MSDITERIGDAIHTNEQMKEYKSSLLAIIQDLNVQVQGRKCHLYTNKDNDQETPLLVTEVKFTENNGLEINYKHKPNPLAKPEAYCQRNLEKTRIVINK